MTSLRKPFFVVGLIALGLAFLVELGSRWAVGGETPRKTQLESALAKEGISDIAVTPKETRPGHGIAYLALLDTLLVLMAGLMGLSLILSERIYARIHGLITLVVTLLDAIAAFAAIFVAVFLLLTMFGLFVATPFGTLAYLAVWGFFDRGTATTMLTTILLLKLAFGVLLVLAHPGFLQNKGFVLLTLTSLVATVVLSLLHGLVPGVMVSITDALGAIIVGVLALIWAIVLFVGSIGSVAKALKIEKSAT